MRPDAGTEAHGEKEFPADFEGGAELSLRIESIAYGGAGVGRVEGMVFFVPFTFPGEQVRVKVVRRQKRFCEARLLSIEVPSPQRLGARCEYFERCGGCSYQHVPYPLQLEWKAAQVGDLLRRVGRIEHPPVQPTVPSPNQWAYRNRIRVHADGKRVGFYSKFSRDLVDVAACPIACDSVNAALSTLRKTNPAPGEYPLSARSDVRFFEQTNDGAAAELLRIVEEAVGGENAALVDAYSGAGFLEDGLPHDLTKLLASRHMRGPWQRRENALAPRSATCAETSQSTWAPYWMPSLENAPWCFWTLRLRA